MDIDGEKSLKREHGSDRPGERDGNRPGLAETANKRVAKEPSSARPTHTDALHALLTQVEKHEMPQRLMSLLGMDDAVSLNQVSTAGRAAVKMHSTLSQMQGKRSVSGTSFWSADPVVSEKRYFKPMSAVGATDSVPHLSEQRGFDSHLTDVASMHWDSGLGKLPAGHYPSKVQFPVVPGGLGGSSRLGAIDAPHNPAKGRVLVEAPSILHEPPRTFVETKSFNKASTGTLPPSYPRTRLSSAQATQTLPAVNTKWTGKEVKSMERPGK